MAVKAFNSEIRDRLDAFRNSFEPPLTNKALARKLNCGPTQVSKYLNGQPDWDVALLETTIEDVLRAEAMRRDAKVSPIETSVIKQVNAVCETIRKTCDMGVILGPAGIGKTVAMETYLQDNSSAIGITISQWDRTDFGVRRLLFRSMETRGFAKSGMGAGEWILSRLANSDRLLIVDSAERLTAAGRQYLFDLHDMGRIPIALIGNPEMLAAIRGVEKQGTRIGIQQEVELGDPARVASAMLRQLAPGTEAEIADLATTIASQKGHLRALKKHLLLVPELIHQFHGDVRRAVLAAHTMLVTDYDLA